MKKALLAGALLLVLLVGGGVWWLLGSLDSLVKDVIETAGSRALGVPVRVSSVHVDLQEGRATLSGLRIANPPGFSSQPIFSLDEVTAAIDVASLTGSPIVIRDIAASAPAVRLEVDPTARINAQELQKGMPKSAPAPPEPDEGSEPPPRLRIELLVVAEGRVKGDASALGQGQVDVVLPTLRLTRLEGTPDEIAQQVASALVARVTKAVARAGVKSEVEKHLGEKAADALGNLFGGDEE